MNIAALSPATAATHTARPPEVSEGSGPDHDGDADDNGISGKPGVSAALPKGVGVSVDTKA